MSLKSEIKKILNENIDTPYDKEYDENMPEIEDTRKPVLTLRHLLRLKKIRDNKREELAQDTVFVPILYGPQENQDEQGGLGGLGGI